MTSWIEEAENTILHDNLLKSLLVPTPEQTVGFAEHVADNHSWYKHLPFFPPGASFVFFPNPHVGRGVKVDGERLVVYDIEQVDYFSHHSRLSTAEYLARFGHWDYWVDDNPRVIEPQTGPWKYSADGTFRAFLPDVFKRQWSCRLTAFLKPAPQMFQLRASALRRESDVFMASRQHSIGRRLLELFNGHRFEDPITRRYQVVAASLRQAADKKGDSALNAFMESESRAQQQIVVGTLHRVRAAWVSHPKSIAKAYGYTS